MRRVVVLVLMAAAACLPGNIVHYQADLVPLADCNLRRGELECLAPADGGTRISGVMSVDERGDDTRVFFRQETLVGTFDGDRLHVENVRELVREQSGCLTRQTLKIDGLVDDPGFGLRREINGSAEESAITDGDPQQCGLNIPYGQVRRYTLHAVEVTQP
ncbi:MAG: hypothetical protein AB2A00_16195 [Myxococcota bacterium]